MHRQRTHICRTRMGIDSESFWKSTEDSCIFVEKIVHYLIKKIFKIMLTIELKNK